MTRSAGEVQIRKATTLDAPRIASVLRQAFAEYEPLYSSEGYIATTPGTVEILKRMSQGPTWVAVHNGQVVGTGSVVRKAEGIYIRGMAVVPAARGLRIGYLILDEIQRFAAANGCKRLFLSTTPFLDRAIRLYEAFGFQRTSDGPYDLFGTPLFTMEKVLPWEAFAQESKKQDDSLRAHGESCCIRH